MTIEEIENDKWTRPSKDSSHLIHKCYEIRRKEIDQLSDSDLRIGISQEISLVTLVPLAINKIERKPFLEADFYPGDLLYNLLLVRSDFWFKNDRLKEKMDDILRTSIPVLESNLKGNTDIIDDFKNLIKNSWHIKN